MTINPNKALWEKGDFTRIAASMRESGDALVQSLDVRPGLEVLDVGSGDGTTAFPAARLGASVTGVDIASNLVAAGNERVRTGGQSNITFREGDASDLHELAAPEGFISPMTWGLEDHVNERFGAAGVHHEQISCERGIYTFRSQARRRSCSTNSGTTTDRP